MIVINNNSTSYSAGGFTVATNYEGPSDLVDGVDYSDTITLDPTIFPNGVEFNWSFPSPSSPAFVYAYPLIKYGDGAPGGPAPTQAADFAALNANYSVAISGDTSDFNVSFELWFTGAPGNDSTTTDELMVMIHTPGAQQPGNQPNTLSDGGLTNATVSVFPNWNAGSTWIPAGWTFIAVENSVDALTGTLNLGDIIKELIWNGVLTGQEYIDDIQLGVESLGGSGSLTVNKLSYQWDANPTITLAAADNAYSVATPGGNDIVGNGGVDTVVYQGAYSQYQIEQSGSETLVQQSGNISSLDVLNGITFVQFSDGTYDVVTSTFTSNVAVPIISSFSPDTGTVGDDITNATTLTLTGTAAANSTVEVFDGSTQLGTAAVNASGVWSFVASTLANGSHVFTATDTDAAGSLSTASAALTVTIDTTPPMMSSVVASGSGITNGAGDLNAGHVVTLTVNLSEAVTVAGGTPTLTLNDGGTATYTGGSGTNALTFSYTVAAGQNTPDLAVKAVNLGTATVTDVAGNAANLAGVVTTFSGLQIDATAPAAPVIVGDQVTGTNQTILNGTAEANSTITVYEGTTSLGTTTANAGGVWNFTTAPLPYGTHTFTATDTDAAGNTSPASQPMDPTISSAGGAVPVIVINAADGTDMSSFTVATQQSVAASSLFTISNPSGDSITEYSFEDNGGGNGYFTLAGTVEPVGQVFTVSASNLNSVQYVGGSAAGTDTLTVDAYDATIGAWISSASLSAVTTATFPLANANDVTEAVYIGYFGRAGDPSGDTYWLNQLSGGNITEAGMAASFSVQPEATALYPFLANPATASQAQITSFIESVYADLFNRAADPSGLAYWDNYLTTNLGNPQVFGAFILAVINGAQGTDQTTITNKVTVADYFTQGLAAAGISFSSAADALAQSTIASITSDPSTVLAAESTISSWGTTATQLSGGQAALAGTGGTFVADPTVVMQQPGNAPASIANGTVLEINTPDNGTVTFAGSTGALWLDQPPTFTGTVSGFGAQDVIDLPGIAFGVDTTLGYLPNSNQTGGTLSLTDSTHSANIALLGNYMASSFAMESDNHGGTMVVVEASQTSNQSLLTTSQHA